MNYAGIHLDHRASRRGCRAYIRSGGAPPCATVRDMLDERISDIDATVTELLSLRRSLIGTRRRADDCCAEAATTICRAIEDPESAI